MTVRATWNGAVVAESDRTIRVEGNQYFPYEDVVAERLAPSETHSICPWKGEASYYDVVVDGERNSDAAWYYPSPLPTAEGIENYVAFWHGVEVTGTNPDAPEILPPNRAQRAAR
jgi:uncharacterized protein (DUF427 family)